MQSLAGPAAAVQTFDGTRIKYEQTILEVWGNWGFNPSPAVKKYDATAPPRGEFWAR